MNDISFLLHGNFIEQAEQLQQAIEQHGLLWTCRASHLSRTAVYNRLAWLQADPAVQQLLRDNLLPTRAELARQIGKLEKAALPYFVAAARELAAQQQHILTAPQVLDLCTEFSVGRPLSPYAAEEEAGLSEADLPFLTPHRLRLSAQQMCESCEVRAQQLDNAIAEPAWQLLINSQRQVCGTCSIQRIADACRRCPAVALLKIHARAGGFLSDDLAVGDD